MKYLTHILIVVVGIFLVACASTQTRKRLPSRQTDGGDLPWDRPSDWEGGLPGMDNNSGRRF